MHTSTQEEEDTDDRDVQGEDDEDEEAESTGINNDNIDKDTARTEKYLRAKSGTIRTMKEEFNLVTANLARYSSARSS